MRREPTLKAVIDRLDAEIKGKSALIVAGRYDAFEHYRQACGYIQGLQEAKTLFEEWEKNIDGEQDD